MKPALTYPRRKATEDRARRADNAALLLAFAVAMFFTVGVVGFVLKVWRSL